MTVFSVRMLIKKGTAIKLGDKEMEYNPSFKLYLHTKVLSLQILFV